MILKANESSLKLPAIGLIEHISFKSENRLMHVTMEDIQNLRKRTPTLKGAPYCCALIHNTTVESTLEIYPTADKDYEFKIVYYPPLQVI